VKRKISWFKVSKAADRSRRMRTERKSALAVRRASVSQRRAVSVQTCLEGSGSRDIMLKCFVNKINKEYRSIV
jgi:hypothetical protein